MELIFYPESEKTPHRDKPKGAYVHMRKVKRYHAGPGRAEDAPEFTEKEEDFYFSIAEGASVENVDNVRIHQKAIVIGFGNFPQRKPYGEIYAYLMERTELAYDNPNSLMRKNLEPKIRAQVEAEMAAKQEEAPKKGKAKQDAGQEAQAA